ncbi:PhzF family phenazine biosynthesis protein [Cohnella sp. GCM10012308]|uniref:PhzF family phenazine biosynthesis protein n=1 Tax=Cohnella sp. GCM10012308 TaxID=3317329 RepID=UPI00360DCB44
MREVTVYHYDAFSRIPNKGNPAGIVLDGDMLTDEQMQEAARKVGFNETAFPLPSDVADLRIRYFTPGHEINLCGHATMATLYALKTRGMLGEKRDLTIETRAGILPMHFDATDAVSKFDITMRQATPQFQAFKGSLKELALSMGIDERDIETQWPTVYGSTGIWTLLVPIKNLSAFERMKPDNKQFPFILKEKPNVSVHPFCFETYDSRAHMHARHFSSPFSGTVEDPVTGTASGVMGAYYARYIKPAPELNLLIEQGQELGRDGIVKVTVINGEQIDITGTAVYVKEFRISI